METRRRADREPKNRKTSAERCERENRLLDAAVHLLVRWGFRKTTVDDVAREAGVGKGTVYLHWKDKNEMFRAAISRASQQAVDDMLERISADPDGGRFHRVFAHGMMAVFANPLLSALMTGKSDIARGLIDTFDTATVDRLFGNSGEQVRRLQEAGLIRDDLPVQVVVFLIGALKMGVLSSSEFTPNEQMPSAGQITAALGDLIRRWLEPEGEPGDSEEGKRITAEWMATNMKIGFGNQSKED